MAYALTLSAGTVKDFSLAGNSYDGTDLPAEIYKWGSGTIYVRSATNIVVTVYAKNAPMAMNVYDNNAWSGWIISAKQSDVNTLNNKQRLISTSTATSTTFTLESTEPFPTFLIIGTNGHTINATIQIMASSVESIQTVSAGTVADYGLNPTFVSRTTCTIQARSYANLTVMSYYPFTITQS